MLASFAPRFPPCAPRAGIYALWASLTCGAAALAGALAAAGWGAPGIVLLLALGLVALGAHIPILATRSLLLATLLLVPDVPSGQSLGLIVHWSQGLTWSNFVVPALALPMLAGAWLAGHKLTPQLWPGLGRWCLWLLGWCLLTLLVPERAGMLATAAAATLLAHLAKLTIFLWLGVVLAADDAAWHRQRGRIFFLGILVNAGVGLGQAVGWLSVFSPLGGWQPMLGVRVSGLFYDANMYGVLAAWALLWLLCETRSTVGKQRWGWWALTLAVACNLVATGSRAGYLALGAGCLVLVWHCQWRPVLQGALLLSVLACIFPARSWQRIRAAEETIHADTVTGGVASAGDLDSSTQERIASMAEAWRQIEHHPLLGLGFGRALYLGVPAFGAGGPVRAAGATQFNGAQNMGLTVLAETGPIGLGLFLVAIADPLRRLHLRPSGAALPLLAGCVGLLAACFTIEALWNTRLLALAVVLTAAATAPLSKLPDAPKEAVS